MSRTIEPATLDTAIREALRFLHAAQALRAVYKARDAKGRWMPSSPDNATCSRASMDLTRALAKMRAGA